MSYATKRKLAIRSKKSPMPVDHPVAVWLDAYRPEIVSASVWDGGLSEFVAGLVRELDVGLEASKRYARVLAGVGAWSLRQGFDLDSEVVLCPATVDAYMAGGLPDGRAPRFLYLVRPPERAHKLRICGWRTSRYRQL